MNQPNLLMELTCRACMKQNDSNSMMNLFSSRDSDDDLAKIFHKFTDLEVRDQHSMFYIL